MNGASMTSLPASAEAAGLPAAWLRDNCPCALCRGPVSGQRLLHITDIPADIALGGCWASADLLCDPAAMLSVRLAPGDCAVFGNTRILHARTGFASSGRRHLQGCYADLDGIESAVAVAGRGDQPE